MTEHLVDRLKEAMCDSSVPLWFPTLSADLADAGWRRVEQEVGLTRSTYGTARMVSQDPNANRIVVVHAGASLTESVGQDAIPIELLSKDMATKCAGTDVRFFEVGELDGNNVRRTVEEALGVLTVVPTALATIFSLVRALHLIDTEDDDIDVSFSEPDLPFSAFISVPGPTLTVGPLRVAEALLHEAMHLLLTLAERFVPLVLPGERTYFSPWRNEYRTPQGVLHALYVFRVIDAFLSEVSFEESEPNIRQQHVLERREMIAHQVGEIHDFRDCADLTPDGAAFVARLLA